MLAEAIGDYLEENLASVYHERDASIVTALSPLLLLVQHYDRSIFPLLWHAPALPYGDRNGVELF